MYLTSAVPVEKESSVIGDGSTKVTDPEINNDDLKADEHRFYGGGFYPGFYGGGFYPYYGGGFGGYPYYGGFGGYPYYGGFGGFGYPYFG